MIFIIIIVLIIILLMFLFCYKIKENYDKTSYYSYENANWKELAPSYYNKNKIWCDSDEECGLAEICVNVDKSMPKGYCQSYVRNKCIYDGVC